MTFARLAFTLALAALPIVPARAELRLAAIFGDNMVLQQEKPVPIWGWCEPDAEVRLNFAGQTRSTHADDTGKWLIKLGKMPASAQPQSLVVEAGEIKVFTNILVGEVWLASGQSNMEKPIGKQPGQKPTFNAEAELAAANYPNIRIFKVAKTLAATPEEDLTKFDGWRECDSNALDSISFSAAAYFFGREIHTSLNVPVGLIESSWGGTRIEPWTPPEGFEEVSGLADLADPNPDDYKIPNTRPMAIYNAMIAPIAGYAIRGALWYQGESNLMGTNADNDYQNYESKMAALVGGWRKIWGEGSFPFYFVQIAPFKYYGGKIHRVNSPDMLPEFWTIQSQAARRIKNTGMVVTTDLVDNLDDIHPRDKADVGHRLALLALDKTYGRGVVSSGPVLRKAEFGGGKATLTFDHADGGLMFKVRNGHVSTWFTIAGKDGRFVPAAVRFATTSTALFNAGLDSTGGTAGNGEVSGDLETAGDTLELSADTVKDPKAVRFAWSETAQPGFYNGAGLPAEPFRTDVPGR